MEQKLQIYDLVEKKYKGIFDLTYKNKQLEKIEPYDDESLALFYEKWMVIRSFAKKDECIRVADEALEKPWSIKPHPLDKNYFLLADKERFQVRYRNCKHMLKILGKCAHWHPQQMRLASIGCDNDNTVVLSCMPISKNDFQKTAAHLQNIKSMRLPNAVEYKKCKYLQWHPKNDLIALRTQPKTLIVADMKNLSVLLYAAKSPIKDLKWSQSGDFILACQNRYIEVWRPNQEETTLFESPSIIQECQWVPGSDSQFVYTTPYSTIVCDHKTGTYKSIVQPMILVGMSPVLLAGVYQKDDSLVLRHVAPLFENLNLNQGEKLLLLHAYAQKEKGLDLYLEKNKKLKEIYDAPCKNKNEDSALRVHQAFREILRFYMNVTR